MSRIGIFGAGYVGLVTGACLAELGNDVTVRDVVPRKIEALVRGEVPIYEPGLEELVARNSERLRFTLDVAEAIDGADFLYICVDTPPTYSGDADLSAVWTVIDELAGLRGRPVVVMKSTVPVGTGEKVRAALDARGLVDVGYVSNPEFTAEGTAVRDFMEPDRIVIGSFDDADADGDAVARLHERLDAPLLRTDVASAEMIKLASNAFLSTRISFINEIANVCELVGADVEQVAKGIGLDHRLGPHFLRAGIGFGGSCLDGRETVLARLAGRIWLTTLERLFAELSSAADVDAIRPEGLDVLSWRPEAETPEFLPVQAATRRPYEGELLEVRTKMGRRVLCTPDHPFVVGDGDGARMGLKLARELTPADWLPVAQGAPPASGEVVPLRLLAGMSAAGLGPEDVVVRPEPAELATVGAAGVRRALTTLAHPRARERSYEVMRAGALRLNEARELGLGAELSSFGTATNGTYVPGVIVPDEDFWRIVGLYIAEGHCSQDGSRHRIQWSFHPRDELELVEEVIRFWRRLGVKADVGFRETSTTVTISSRLLAGWWLGTLGLGADCYAQRIPDLIWTSPEIHKRALLAGLWLGDGSWSYVSGGPSIVLEYGTVSRQLADGILRVLGDLGVVARLKVGRSAKSTCDTYWLTVAGADQVEGLLDFVPEEDRTAIRASLARQAKRIAPTGYRRLSPNASWVRVADVSSRPSSGCVYALEVPDARTFVTTGGLTVHNCFPKDVSALKQLAGNSGYHFQLLSAVWEVNELQKRRVIGKLEKHLGKLHGRTVALLGLAFKPNTDDLREAPSIVIASRLLAEGAEVRAWDPVADARQVLQGVTFHYTPLETVRGADAAVIVTEWAELRSLDLAEAKAAMRNPLLIDGRNFVDPDAARAAGFVYEGIGRAASPFAVPEAEERKPAPAPSPRT